MEHICWCNSKQLRNVAVNVVLHVLDWVVVLGNSTVGGSRNGVLRPLQTKQ